MGEGTLPDAADLTKDVKPPEESADAEKVTFDLNEIENVVIPEETRVTEDEFDDVPIDGDADHDATELLRDDDLRGKSRYGRVRKPKLKCDFVSVDKKSFTVMNSGSYEASDRKEGTPDELTLSDDSGILKDVGKVSDFDVKPLKTYLRKSDVNELVSFSPSNHCGLNWKIGDVTWAKVGTYPYWPSIVTLEYGSDVYVKDVGKNISRLAVHVQFFGDRGRRSWVLTTSLIKFESRDQFMELKKFYAKDKIRHKYFLVRIFKDLWEKAVIEASTVLKLSHTDRIEYYKAIYPVAAESYVLKSKVPRVKKKKNPNEHRGRKRKMKSDVEASPPSKKVRVDTSTNNPNFENTIVDRCLSSCDTKPAKRTKSLGTESKTSIATFKSVTKIKQKMPKLNVSKQDMRKSLATKLKQETLNPNKKDETESSAIKLKQKTLKTNKQDMLESPVVAFQKTPKPNKQDESDLPATELNQGLPIYDKHDFTESSNKLKETTPNSSASKQGTMESSKQTPVNLVKSNSVTPSKSWTYSDINSRIEKRRDFMKRMNSVIHSTKKQTTPRRKYMTGFKASSSSERKKNRKYIAKKEEPKRTDLLSVYDFDEDDFQHVFVKYSPLKSNTTPTDSVNKIPDQAVTPMRPVKCDTGSSQGSIKMLDKSEKPFSLSVDAQFEPEIDENKDHSNIFDEKLQNVDELGALQNIGSKSRANKATLMKRSKFKKSRTFSKILRQKNNINKINKRRKLLGEYCSRLRSHNSILSQTRQVRKLSKTNIESLLNSRLRSKLLKKGKENKLSGDVHNEKIKNRKINCFGSRRKKEYSLKRRSNRTGIIEKQKTIQDKEADSKKERLSVVVHNNLTPDGTRTDIGKYDIPDSQRESIEATKKSRNIKCDQNLDIEKSVDLVGNRIKELNNSIALDSQSEIVGHTDIFENTSDGGTQLNDSIRTKDDNKIETKQRRSRSSTRKKDEKKSVEIFKSSVQPKTKRRSRSLKSSDKNEQKSDNFVAECSEVNSYVQMVDNIFENNADISLKDDSTSMAVSIRKSSSKPSIASENNRKKARSSSSQLNKKSQFFGGAKHEKLCTICEKPGLVVRCRGQCCGYFHVQCDLAKNANLVNEVPASLNRRGRQKKKLDEAIVNSSREQTLIMDVDKEPLSCTDSDKDSGADLSSGTSVESETMPFSLVEEILEVNGNDVIMSEYDSLSSQQDLSTEPSESGYSEKSNEIVLKSDQLVVLETDRYSDVSDNVDSAVFKNNFQCSMCRMKKLYPCFSCGLESSAITHNEERYRCNLGSCGRVYHLECLKEWPQTTWVSANGKQRSDVRSANSTLKECFICPQHHCHTCISENPTVLKNKLNSDKLVRCIKCPTSYHARVHCIPAGSEILTMTQIVCPRHYVPPKLKQRHCNTVWCFLCCMGGSLICCDQCPTSFHAECLKLEPNEYEGRRFICEDCQSGRYLLYGEICWVKLGHYRWWPSLILFPHEVPENIRDMKHCRGEFVVQFFGTLDYNWVNRGRAFLYQEGDTGKRTLRKSSVDLSFERALHEAENAYKKLQSAKAERAEGFKTGSKPPRYIKLKSNKPVGNVRIVELNTSNITACECDPFSENPCSSDSVCLNRMLLVECNPLVCPAGEKCNNQAFEKRLYPAVVPFPTGHRGWGLKTLENLKKGSFIIEYVGEMIDEEEYKRRIAVMHEQHENNYYFLTIDKDRMLDAGPKGNVARFMNHSCDPNCETQKWTVNGDTRVGLFAVKDIPAGTELVFNYNLATQGNEMTPCLCGSEKCSGFIGVKATKNGDDKRAENIQKLSASVLKKKRLVTRRKLKKQRAGKLPATGIRRTNPILKMRKSPKKVTVQRLKMKPKISRALKNPRNMKNPRSLKSQRNLKSPKTLKSRATLKNTKTMKGLTLKRIKALKGPRTLKRPITLKITKVQKSPKVLKNLETQKIAESPKVNKNLYTMLKKRFERKFQQMKDCKLDNNCFICGKRGDLLICDSNICVRGYHLSCVNKDEWPAGQWLCPWHYCSICGSKRNVKRCYKCINSFCKQHCSDNIFEFEEESKGESRLRLACIVHYRKRKTPTKESNRMKMCSHATKKFAITPRKAVTPKLGPRKTPSSRKANASKTPRTTPHGSRKSTSAKRGKVNPLENGSPRKLNSVKRKLNYEVKDAKRRKRVSTKTEVESLSDITVAEVEVPSRDEPEIQDVEKNFGSSENGIVDVKTSANVEICEIKQNEVIRQVESEDIMNNDIAEAEKLNNADICSRSEVPIQDKSNTDAKTVADSCV